MVYSLVLLVALAISVSSTSAPDVRHAPGFLSYPLERVERTLPVLAKRVDTEISVLNVGFTTYMVRFEIGSPGQSVNISIDTGSSELWVNPDCTASPNTTFCDSSGQYDPAHSSTSKVTNSTNTLSYGAGSANVQYVVDNIAMPGSAIKLSQVTFGSATASTQLSTGLLGLSFGQNYNTDYPNIIDQLYLQNVTSTRAYGIALGAAGEPANSGVLTFGGVDTKKFQGSLHSLPVLPPSLLDDVYRFWVTLDAVGLNGKTYTDSQTTVFLDTGTTLSYLPSGVLSQFASDLQGEFDGSTNLYIVPCDQSGTLSFGFGSLTIDIKVDQIIVHHLGQCYIGIGQSINGESILGESFLRSVYAVFDIDTPAVHLAQYVNCGSNEQTILGKNAIDSLVGECGTTSSTGKTGTATSLTKSIPRARAIAAWVIALIALL